MHYGPTSRENRCSPTAEMRRDQQRFGTFGEYTGSRNSRNQSLKSDDHRYYFHPTFRQRPTDTGTFIPRPRSVDMNLLYEEVLAVQEIDHVPSLMERYEEKSIEYDQGPLRIREETVFEETDPVISEDIVNEVHLVSGVWRYVRTLRRSRSERRMFKKLRKRSVFSRKSDEEDQKPQRWEAVVRDRAQRSSSMGGTVPFQDPVSIAGPALRDSAGGAARQFDDGQQASDRRQDILGLRLKKRHYDEPSKEIGDAAPVTESGHSFGQTVLQMSQRPRVPSDLSVGQAPSYPRFVTEITLPPQTDVIGRSHARSPIHSESMSSDIADSSYLSSVKAPLTNDTPPPSLERRKEREPTTIGSILSWHHDSKPQDQKRTVGDGIRPAPPDARNLSGIVSWHIERSDEATKKSQPGTSVEQIVRWHTTDAADGKNRIEGRKTGYEPFDEEPKLPGHVSSLTTIRLTSDIDDSTPQCHDHAASPHTSDASRPLIEPSKIIVSENENRDQFGDQTSTRQQAPVRRVSLSDETTMSLTTKPTALLAEHHEPPITLRVRPPFVRRSSAANEESPSSYFFRHKLAREKAAEDTKGPVEARQGPSARLPYESSGTASDTDAVRHPSSADTSVFLPATTFGLSDGTAPIKGLIADSSQGQGIANGSGDTSSNEASQEIFYEAEELPFDKPKGQREAFTAVERSEPIKLEKDRRLSSPGEEADKQAGVDFSRAADLEGASRLEDAQSEMKGPKVHGGETRTDTYGHAAIDEPASESIESEKQPFVAVTDAAPKEPAAIEGVKRIMEVFKDYPSKLLRHLQTKKPDGMDKDDQTETRGNLERTTLAATKDVEVVETAREAQGLSLDEKFRGPARPDEAKPPTTHDSFPATAAIRKHEERAAGEHETIETDGGSDVPLTQGIKSDREEPTMVIKSAQLRDGDRRDALEDAVEVDRVGPVDTKYVAEKPPLASEIMVPGDGKKDLFKPKESYRTAVVIDEFSNFKAGKAVTILAGADESYPAAVTTLTPKEPQFGDKTCKSPEAAEHYADNVKDKLEGKGPTARRKTIGGQKAHRHASPEATQKPTDEAGTDRRTYLPKRQAPPAPVLEHPIASLEGAQSSRDQAEAANEKKDHQTDTQMAFEDKRASGEQAEDYRTAVPRYDTAKEKTPEEATNERPVPDGIKSSDQDLAVKLDDILPVAAVGRTEPYEEAISQVSGACEAIVSRIKEGITLAKEKLEAVPDLFESTVESIIASGMGDGDKDWSLDPAMSVASLSKDSISPAGDHDLITPDEGGEPPKPSDVRSRSIQQPQAAATWGVAHKPGGGESAVDDVQWTDAEVPPDVLLVPEEVRSPIDAGSHLRIKEVEPPSTDALEVPLDGEFSCLITPAAAATRSLRNELEAGEEQAYGTMPSTKMSPGAPGDLASSRFPCHVMEGDTQPDVESKTAMECIEEGLEEIDVEPQHGKIVEQPLAKATVSVYTETHEDRAAYLQGSEGTRVATPLEAVAQDRIEAEDAMAPEPDEVGVAEQRPLWTDAPEIRPRAATGIHAVPARGTSPELIVPGRVDGDTFRAGVHPGTAPWADTVVLEILKFHATLGQILSKQGTAVPISTQEQSHEGCKILERSPIPSTKTMGERHTEDEVQEEQCEITAKKQMPTPGELDAIPSAVGKLQTETEAPRLKKRRETSTKGAVEPQKGHLQKDKTEEPAGQPPKEHSRTPTTASGRESEKPDADQATVTKEPGGPEERRRKKGDERGKSAELKAEERREATQAEPEVGGQLVATEVLGDEHAKAAEQFAAPEKSISEVYGKSEGPVELKQRTGELEVPKMAMPAGRDDFVAEKPDVKHGVITEQIKPPKEPKHKKRERGRKSAEIKEEDGREAAAKRPTAVSRHHCASTDTLQEVQVVETEQPEALKEPKPEEGISKKGLVEIKDRKEEPEEALKAAVPTGRDDSVNEQPGVDQAAVTGSIALPQEAKHRRRDRREKSAEIKVKAEKEAARKEPVHASDHGRPATGGFEDTHLIKAEQLEAPRKSIPGEAIKGERLAELEQNKAEAGATAVPATATGRDGPTGAKAGTEHALTERAETVGKLKPREDEEEERLAEVTERQEKVGEGEKSTAANKGEDFVCEKPDVEHAVVAGRLEIPKGSKHKKEAKRGISAEAKEKRKAAAAREPRTTTVTDRSMGGTPGNKQPPPIAPLEAAGEPKVEDDARAGEPVEIEEKEKAAAGPEPAAASGHHGLSRKKTGNGQTMATEQLGIPREPKYKKGRKREKSAEVREGNKAASGEEPVAADGLFTVEMPGKKTVVTEGPEAPGERKTVEEVVVEEKPVHPEGDRDKEPAKRRPMKLSKSGRPPSDVPEVESATAERPQSLESSEPMGDASKEKLASIKRGARGVASKAAGTGSDGSISEKLGSWAPTAAEQLEVLEDPKHKKGLKILKSAITEEGKEGAVADKGPTTSSGTIHPLDDAAGVEPAVTTGRAETLKRAMPKADAMKREPGEARGKPTVSVEAKDRRRKIGGKASPPRPPGSEEVTPETTADRAPGVSPERTGEQRVNGSTEKPIPPVGHEIDRVAHQALPSVLAVLDWHKSLYGRPAKFQETGPVDGIPPGSLASSHRPGGQIATEQYVPEAAPRTGFFEESRPSNLASILENHRKLVIIVTPPSESPSDEAPDSGNSVDNLVRIINDVVNVNKIENKVCARVDEASRDKISRAAESGDLTEIIPAGELDLNNFDEKPPAEDNGYFELLERRCHESEQFAPTHMRSPATEENKLFDWSPLADLSSCATDRAPLPEMIADLLESEPSRADLIKLPAPPAAAAEPPKCEGLFGPIYGEDSFGYKKVFGPDDSTADQSKTLWDEPARRPEPEQQILLDEITHSLEGVIPAYDHAIRTMNDLTRMMDKGAAAEKRPARPEVKETKAHDTAAEEAVAVEATRNFKDWLASALYYSAALCWWSTEGKALLMEYYRRISTDPTKKKPAKPQGRGPSDEDHREVRRLVHEASPPKGEKAETELPSDIRQQHAPEHLSASAASVKAREVLNETSEAATSKPKHPYKKASGKRSAESHSTEPPSKIPVPIAKGRKDSSGGTARARTPKTFAEEELSSSPQRHKHSSPLLRREHQLKQSYQKDLQMLRDLNSELAILLQGDESGRVASPSFKAGAGELSSSETTPEVKSEKRERNISSSDRSSPFEAASDADSRCRQRGKKPKWKKPDIKSDATLSESFSKISASRTDDRRSPSLEPPPRKMPDPSHAETKLAPPRPARNISTETAAKKLAQLLPPFCYTLPGKLGFSVASGGDSPPKNPTEHEEVDSPFDTLVPRFIRKEPDSVQSSTSGKSNDESKPRLRQRRTDKSPSGR